MKYWGILLAAAVALLCGLGPAEAQYRVVASCQSATALYPPNGTGVAAVIDTAGNLCINGTAAGTAPYQFSPSATAGSDQHNLAVTSATGLTVPADAICANISTRGGAVNWRWDGTAPTGSVGNQQPQNTMAQFCGRNVLAALQFIQITGATSTIDVTYSK